jgi:hypothetical protein
VLADTRRLTARRVTYRILLPIGPLEEVDEVDAQGMFGLPDLPVFPLALAFQGLAECAHLIGQ